MSSKCRSRVDYSPLVRKTFCWAALVMLFGPARAQATVVVYDAAGGQLPQNVGWRFFDQNNPSSTVSVVGGILEHDSGMANLATWEVDLGLLNGTRTDAGVFMETEAKVISELNMPPPGGNERGVSLSTVRAINGVISAVGLVANEHRVFVRDENTDVVLASVAMDTTDRFHTYRLELLDEDAWLFVDGNLAASVTTSLEFLLTFGISGAFGDGSAFSESRTQRRSVTIGSLADVGGPTVPEPSTFVLAALGLAGLLAYAWRRRTLS